MHSPVSPNPVDAILPIGDAPAGGRAIGARPIAHDARLRIGLLPEEHERPLRQVFEERVRFLREPIALPRHRMLRRFSSRRWSTPNAGRVRPKLVCAPESPTRRQRSQRRARSRASHSASGAFRRAIHSENAPKNGVGEASLLAHTARRRHARSEAYRSRTASGGMTPRKTDSACRPRGIDLH